MVSDAKAPVIVSVPWRPEHDERLKISAGDDLAMIREQVKTGVASLWHCTSESNEGFVVMRIDPGPEMCIVLGEGSGFYEFAPHFLAVAKQHNIPVRTHVKRPGLIRMWSRLGLSIDEYVLRN